MTIKKDYFFFKSRNYDVRKFWKTWIWEFIETKTQYNDGQKNSKFSIFKLNHHTMMPENFEKKQKKLIIITWPRQNHNTKMPNQNFDNDNLRDFDDQNFKKDSSFIFLPGQIRGD